MGLKLANNALSRLSASISPTDTTVTLVPGGGSLFPTVGAGDWFPATIVKADGTLEIVKVIGRATDVLTVVRAQEDTTAKAFNAGDRIELRLTAGTYAAQMQDQFSTIASQNNLRLSGTMLTPIAQWTSVPQMVTDNADLTDELNYQAQALANRSAASVRWADAIIGFDASGMVDKALIHFHGRNAAGDGGGGPLRFLAGSTATANGVTVYAVTGGRLVREGWSVFGVDVRWAGAKCDGVTDDTAAVQAAIDVSNRVCIPEGVCLVGVLNLRSNLVLFGGGRTSIIKQGDGVTGSRGSLYANSGSASTQLENITIHDLQVLGQVATKGFSEFVHLVSLNGVKNVLLNRVHFAGFQGDGLYLGSGIYGGDERHNRDIKVLNCTWDGINNQNRNGISVIDVDNLVVLNPQFANCTAPSMPGCIDMEPDGNAFAVMRNIYIHNVVTSNCGGNVGHVSLFTRAAIAAGASYPLNITIDGVWVYSPKVSQGIAVCVITGIDHNESTEVNNVVVKNVVAYNGTIPYDIRGCKKLTVENSTFVDFTNTANMGYFGAGGANYDVTHRGNTYVRIGNNFGNAGVGVFDVRRMHSIDNTYRDCGLTGGTSGVAMNFDHGTSSGVTLENETYLSTGRMLTAVGKEASHTFSPATNRYVGNKRGALRNNFQAYLTDDAGTTVNVYDGNTAPTAFPMGVSITVVNGAANIPTGYAQGILKTERYTDEAGYTGWITQYFIPRNTTPTALNEMYWRKSSLDDSSWSEWVKVVAAA